jgi:hypothetical protein
MGDNLVIRTARRGDVETLIHAIRPRGIRNWDMRGLQVGVSTPCLPRYIFRAALRSHQTLDRVRRVYPNRLFPDNIYIYRQCLTVSCRSPPSVKRPALRARIYSSAAIILRGSVWGNNWRFSQSVRQSGQTLMLLGSCWRKSTFLGTIPPICGMFPAEPQSWKN